MRIRCPHCHNPVEILSDSEFKDVDCPSCGSRFNLAIDVATVSHDASGRFVAHFRLLEALGTGSFGSVWKAHDTELHRTVALKIPRKAQLAEDEQEQFFREARAAAQLQHAHIVTVHEVGREDGTIYIASDYVEGANLRDWLKNQRLTPKEAAELCRKIADALHHAHEQGVVHRDLKPSNIMLDLEGEPHIMDFGLAKRDSDEITMTIQGKILGTPAYMSPEQARGDSHKADRRADIYSLGVVFYELLTGELPFRGEKRMLIVQIQKDEPKAPRRIDSRVPRDLETICLKCLEKEPGRRYATAKEVAVEFTRFQEGKPIIARPIGTVGRVSRWCMRNPTAAGVVGLLLFLAIAGPLVAFNQNRLALNATQATTQADLQRNAALKAKAAADGRLVSMQVANGVRLMEAGDLPASLLWFAEAISMIPEDSPNARVHRIRFARIARQCPRPIRIFNDELHYFQLEYFSQDGRYRLDVKGIDYEKLKDVKSKAEYRAAISAMSKLGAEATIWDVMTGTQIGQTMKLAHSVEELSGSFSPDGRRVVTHSDADMTMQVWDTATGKPISPLMKFGELSPNRPICDVSLSGDGQFLATHVNEVTRLWDVKTGQPIVLPVKSSDRAEFSPNGGHVAIIGDEGLRIWDIVRRKPITPFMKVDQPVIAFSVDGRRIAISSEQGSSSDAQVSVWDTSTGQAAVTRLKSASMIDRLAAISPDGKRFITISFPKSAWIWNASTGEATRLLHRNNINDASFSPDGLYVVTASDDGSARVWDASTGQAVAPPLRHRGEVRQARFGANGHLVFTSGEDGVRVWDWAQADRLRAYKLPLSIWTFSPDLSHGISFIDRSDSKRAHLVAVNGANSKPIPLPHSGHVYAASFSGDGSLVATGSGNSPDVESMQGDAQVWDAKTGVSIGSPMVHGGRVVFTEFSPNGRLLFTVSERKSDERDVDFWVWDLVTNRPLISRKILDGFDDARFTPDGKRIVILAGFGTIHIVDVVTRTVTRVTLRVRGGVGGDGGGGSFGGMTGNHKRRVAISRDGSRAIVCSGDSHVFILDPRTGEQIGRVIRGQRINHVAFSPDGKTILTVREMSVRLWNSDTGQPVTPPLLHQDHVEYASFSPDGFLVVSAGTDKTARIWDALTGEPVCPSLRHSGTVQFTAFTNNGRHVFTASYRDISIWNLQSDRRPIQDLVQTAQILAGGNKLDATGSLRPLESETYRSQFRRLQTKYPDDFDSKVVSQRILAWHRSKAGKSEAAQQWFAAAFHLSKLLDAATKDADLHYRRGRANNRLQRYDSAHKDLTKAIGLNEKSRDIWYERATTLYRMKKWEDVIHDLSMAIELKTDDVMCFALRARAFAELNRWKPAASDFGKTAQLSRTAAVYRYYQALSLLAVNDVVRYRSVCQQMLKEFGQKPGANARWLAWTCTLAPQAVPNLSPPTQLAEKLAASNQNSQFDVNTLGAILYRGGRFKEAVRQLRKVVSRSDQSGGIKTSPTYAWLFLAMAHHRLGNHTEARMWLKKAVESVEDAAKMNPKGDSVGTPRPWNRRLTIKLLRQEAEHLMKLSNP